MGLRKRVGSMKVKDESAVKANYPHMHLCKTEERLMKKVFEDEYGLGIAAVVADVPKDATPEEMDTKDKAAAKDQIEQLMLDSLGVSNKTGEYSSSEYFITLMCALVKNEIEMTQLHTPNGDPLFPDEYAGGVEPEETPVEETEVP